MNVLEHEFGSALTHLNSSMLLLVLLPGDGDIFHPEKRIGNLNLFQSSSTTRSNADERSVAIFPFLWSSTFEF
jgi:hypothetical protein